MQYSYYMMIGAVVLLLLVGVYYYYQPYRKPASAATLEWSHYLKNGESARACVPLCEVDEQCLGFAVNYDAYGKSCAFKYKPDSRGTKDWTYIMRGSEGVRQCEALCRKDNSCQGFIADSDKYCHFRYNRKDLDPRVEQEGDYQVYIKKNK